MAKMSSAQRNALPKSSFGLPGEGKFPMPDKAHAANAKARATQQVKKGNLSPSSKNKVDAKANRILKSAKPGKMSGSQAQKAAGRIRSRISTRKKNKTQVGFD